MVKGKHYRFVRCCNEIQDTNHNHISVSGNVSYDELEPGKVFYWTGEETEAHDVEINYCPFCGEKLKVIVRDLKE